MSSRVFVSPPVLRRTANRLESARIQMQQMLTALERVKRDLPSYWSGPYTSAYLARIDETYKKAKRNLQNIEAIQKSLRYVAHQTAIDTAASKYDSGEAEVKNIVSTR